MASGGCVPVTFRSLVRRFASTPHMSTACCCKFARIIWINVFNIHVYLTKYSRKQIIYKYFFLENRDSIYNLISSNFAVVLRTTSFSVNSTILDTIEHSYISLATVDCEYSESLYNAHRDK